MLCVYIYIYIYIHTYTHIMVIAPTHKVLLKLIYIVSGTIAYICHYCCYVQPICRSEAILQPMAITCHKLPLLLNYKPTLLRLLLALWFD